MSRLIAAAAPLAAPELSATCGHARCTQLRAERVVVACADLPGSELIAARARAFAGEVLRAKDWSPLRSNTDQPLLLDRVVRVVSELATNALLHGGVRGSTVARIYPDDGAVWFEIDDRSAAEPQIHLPGADIEEKTSGWGLFLVDCLTDEFGWREVDGGKTVFARWNVSVDAAGTGRSADAAGTGTEAVGS